MLAICAALWWEIGPVLDCIGEVRKVTHDGLRVWQPLDRRLPVLLFRTGVGPEKAAAATRSLLQAHRVEAVLNTGCAGALVPGLAAGELVIPSACYEEGGEYVSDPALTARVRLAAESAGIKFDRGPILTSPVPLVRLDKRQEAQRRWQVTAVEMEGAAVARVAREHALPFASVRSILDPVHLDLPLMEESVRNRGLSDRLKLSSKALGQPGQFPSLVQVAVGARAVRTSLRRLFAALLSDIVPVEEGFEKGR